ncbi:MAG TPA: hypothetical protein PK772_06575 [Chitinophagaceae bacterium]|nr:hypothetical protein [Chitinophagaceae bacterium]
MITTTQSFKIYEILQRYFKNDADAKALVGEIEQIVDNRFLAERDRLATKEDLVREIGSLETKMEKNFKDQLKWMIILMFGFSSFIIAMIKLL